MDMHVLKKMSRKWHGHQGWLMWVHINYISGNCTLLANFPMILQRPRQTKVCGTGGCVMREAKNREDIGVKCWDEQEDKEESTDRKLGSKRETVCHFACSQPQARLWVWANQTLSQTAGLLLPAEILPLPETHTHKFPIIQHVYVDHSVRTLHLHF